MPTTLQRLARVVLSCAVPLAVLLASASAQAQNWPTQPVRLVVPFAAGGAFDTFARLVGQGLSERLGQAVVIDNRPGAGGTIAADHVAKSAPDGHTVLVGDVGTNAIAPWLYAQLPYDPVADFQPIHLSASAATILVTSPSFAPRDLAGVIAAARARPGQLNYASSGQGGISHLAVELLRARAALDIVHVPYKGGALALNDVMAGRVEMMIPSVSTALPHIRSGKLRAIAVTSAVRNPLLPEVPTMQEAGVPEYVVGAWMGLLAPRGTPAPVVDRLHRELSQVLARPEVRERLGAMGFDVVDKGPQAFGDHLQRELVMWRDTVRAAGLRPQ